MHAIERELIDASEFKPAKKYPNRQAYLRAIAAAADSLSDEEFDNLTEEASGWIASAVEAINTKADLPDFDEVDSDDDEEDDTADDEGEDDAEDDESEADDEEAEDDDDDSDPEEDGEVDDEDDEEADQDEPEDSGMSDTEPDPEDDDEEPEPAPPVSKRGKSAAKPKAEKAASSKAAPKAKPEKKAAAPKAKEKEAPKKPSPRPKRERDEDGEIVLDRWGSIPGSKNSRALEMFSKGATTTEVKRAVGGTYYNLMKKMVTLGHRIEKQGALITLIHKDDLKKASPAKKAKK